VQNGDEKVGVVVTGRPTVKSFFRFRFRFTFNRIVARRLKITQFTANRKNIKIEYNRQQDNATMRYKHTVDYDVAQNSEWQQGRLC